MNASGKKHTLRTILIVAAVLAALVAAVLLISRRMHSQTVNVYAVSDMAETYWGDSTELTGQVTEGSVENIPLDEGMVQSFAVQKGDKVKKGDILVRYDTSSYQLTLSSDQAEIAMLKSEINEAQRDLQAYRNMKPRPVVTPTPPPTPKPLPKTVETVEADTEPAEVIDGVKYFNCTVDTTVQAPALLAVRESGDRVAFRLYQERDMLGLWFVSGQDLQTLYDDEWEPADWVLGKGLTLNGDGTVSIDFELTHYGVFESRLPGGDEEDDGFWDDPDPGGYTAEEIAAMIKEKAVDIQNFQRELQQAEIKYKRDQLTGKSGEVCAANDGVVTYVADPHAIAVGETLLTIRGSASAIVTVYVDELSLQTLKPGDLLMVNSYETGAFFTARVQEVGSEPAEEYSWDPNNSMYPVTCVSEDADVELNIGEYCSVTPEQTSEQSDALYLPLYFIREDAQGSYVLAADENGHLERRAVSTGKMIWGSSIEITRGLTTDDRIAFPYGRSARPGSPTRDASPEALWGME